MQARDVGDDLEAIWDGDWPAQRGQRQKPVLNGRLGGHFEESLTAFLTWASTRLSPTQQVIVATSEERETVTDALRDTAAKLIGFDGFIRRFETNYMRAAIYGIMSIIQWLSIIARVTSLIAAAVVLLVAALCYLLAGVRGQAFVNSKTLGGQGVAQMIV